MLFMASLLDNWKLIVAVAVGAVLLLILIAVFINKGRYAARYKNFYKKMDKTITKHYNSNLLIETLIEKYTKDQTNTFKSLKSQGKHKVTSYLDYYVKNVPELVLLKSFISSDRNKSEIAILLVDEFDKVIYRWNKAMKTKGLIKMANKYQMMNPLLAFFYELPMHINENLPFRFTNHDNDYRLSYEITKNAKKTIRKQKEKKLSRAEQKAQAKLEAIKAKRDAKLQKRR